ncbi:Rrf2 family transcriptional regulator [Candidatus Bipolaricaulota bacterium]|nr:Rrf2 family transcriptional regulator [Candidatus Bipolaricaulota bacterium]
MKIERRIYIGMLVAKALAENGESLKSARGIAETLGLPEISVRQALVRLRRAGILKAEKGRQGGYRLARPPEKIPLFAVLSALTDGDFSFALLSERGRRGRPIAPDKKDPLAGFWEGLEREFRKALEGKTLADLL